MFPGYRLNLREEARHPTQLIAYLANHRLRGFRSGPVGDGPASMAGIDLHHGGSAPEFVVLWRIDPTWRLGRSWCEVASRPRSPAVPGALWPGRPSFEGRGEHNAGPAWSSSIHVASARRRFWAPIGDRSGCRDWRHDLRLSQPAKSTG